MPYLDEEAGRRREKGRAGASGIYGQKRVATAIYDFAVLGGTVGQKTLDAVNAIPAGAIITGARIDVLTVLAGGAGATVSVDVEAAGDIQAAAVFSGAPWSTTGPKVASAGTNVKTTAARNIKATIAVAALTAGKFAVYIDYQDTRT